MRHGTEGHRGWYASAWRRMRKQRRRRRRKTSAAASARRTHEGYDRCPEIKGLPTERNKVSQSRWRPACSNVIGCGSGGMRYSSHTDPMPDFFHVPPHSPHLRLPRPLFSGRELPDTGNWRKRGDTGTRARADGRTSERASGGGGGGGRRGWIFVIMKRR